MELPDGLPRRPDGDVELSHGMRDFRVPPCASCGGFLKPNVVFCEAYHPRWLLSRLSAWSLCAQLLHVLPLLVLHGCKDSILKPAVLHIAPSACWVPIRLNCCCCACLQRLARLRAFIEHYSGFGIRLCLFGRSWYTCSQLVFTSTNDSTAWVLQLMLLRFRPNRDEDDQTEMKTIDD